VGLREISAAGRADGSRPMGDGLISAKRTGHNLQRSGVTPVAKFEVVNRGEFGEALVCGSKSAPYIDFMCGMVLTSSITLAASDSRPLCR